MQIVISDLAVNDPTNALNVLRNKVERSNGSRDERCKYFGPRRVFSYSAIFASSTAFGV